MRSSDAALGYCDYGRQADYLAGAVNVETTRQVTDFMEHHLHNGAGCQQVESHYLANLEQQNANWKNRGDMSSISPETSVCPTRY